MRCGACRGCGRDFQGAVVVDAHLELAGGTLHDAGELVVVVVVEAAVDAEARTHRRRNEAAPRRCADEGELREVKAYRTGVWPLVDHDVDDEVLHRGIEVFLDGALHAVDFVNEDDVTGLKAGEKTGQIAGLVDDGAGGRLDAHAHFLAEDEGQCRFSKAGRA